MKKVLTRLGLALVVALTVAVALMSFVSASSGTGNTESDPVVCTTFEDFKNAMEDPDVLYVELDGIAETLPQLYKGNTSYEPAITVAGEKHLKVKGDNDFKTPIVINPNTQAEYSSLIFVPKDAMLIVEGNGGISYTPSSKNALNAIIHNRGYFVADGAVAFFGNVGYERGMENYAICLFNEYGTAEIYNGYFYATNAHSVGYGNDVFSAVKLAGTSTTYISKGSFFASNSHNGNKETYGLEISSGAKVEIEGGEFESIKLPTRATKFSDYIDESVFTTLADYTVFDPTSTNSQDIMMAVRVDVVRMIKKIELNVSAPVAGAYLLPDISFGSRGYDHNPSIYWTVDGNTIFSPDTPVKFVEGSSYSFEVILNVDESQCYQFAPVAEVTATVNGKTAVVSEAWYPGKMIRVSYDFGVCTNEFDQVAVEVNAPFAGNYISNDIFLGDYEKYSYNPETDIQWYVYSDDGRSKSPVSEGSRFVYGNNYEVVIKLQAINGYSFKTDAGGVPDVYAKVNGGEATVKSISGVSSSSSIGIVYRFPFCKDPLVKNVAITGVRPPVAGALPSYKAESDGVGYSINSSSFSSVSANGYWKKNGVSWYDNTENRYIYEKERFIEGHNYTVNVEVIQLGEYEFYVDSISNLTTGTVNGNTATMNTPSLQGGKTKQVAAYTFYWSPVTVDRFELTDIPTPVAGHAPNYTANVGQEHLYGLAGGFDASSFYWIDSEGAVMTEDDVFVAGEFYTLEVKLVPQYSGEVLMSTFSTSPTASINGVEISKEDIYATSSKVYLYADYLCKETETTSISGFVSGIKKSTDVIHIELTEYGFNEPFYSTSFTGASPSYLLDDVDCGVYKIKIYGAGYVAKERIIRLDSLPLEINFDLSENTATIYMYASDYWDTAVAIDKAAYEYAEYFNVIFDLEDYSWDIYDDMTIGSYSDIRSNTVMIANGNIVVHAFSNEDNWYYYTTTMCGQFEFADVTIEGVTNTENAKGEYGGFVFPDDCSGTFGYVKEHGVFDGIESNAVPINLYGNVTVYDGIYNVISGGFEAGIDDRIIGCGVSSPVIRLYGDTVVYNVSGGTFGADNYDSVYGMPQIYVADNVHVIENFAGGAIDAEYSWLDQVYVEIMGGKFDGYISLAGNSYIDDDSRIKFVGDKFDLSDCIGVYADIESNDVVEYATLDLFRSTSKTDIEGMSSGFENVFAPFTEGITVSFQDVSMSNDTPFIIHFMGQNVTVGANSYSYDFLIDFDGYTEFDNEFDYYSYQFGFEERIIVPGVYNKIKVGVGDLRSSEITLNNLSRDTKIQNYVFGVSLTLSDSIAVNMSGDSSLFDDYSDVMVTVVFKGQSYNYYSPTSDNGTSFRYSFTNLGPQMMGDTVYFVIEARNGNGEVVTSGILKSSVKKYAVDSMNLSENTAEFKAVCMDLLNYGAKAQLYANYKTDELVTSDMDAYQKYASKSQAVPTSCKKIEKLTGATVSVVGPSLYLDKNVELRYAYKTSENLSDLSAKVVIDGTQTITIGYSDFVVTDAAKGEFYIRVNQLNPSQMRDTVKVTIMKGNTAVSHTITYSIASYVYDYTVAGALMDAVKAMLTYGDAVVAWMA
ncbi:MAG: hypothetical protein IJN17_04250 [Clostridia bacterium]|nr:hypothetical protein [Clostridia bacterium]